MKKGFSIISTIIIILIISVLGAGGYYAYTNYYVPMQHPNLAYIPKNLAEYAKGENAEIFMIIKNENSKLDNILERLEIPENYNIPVKYGIIVVNSAKECAGAAFEFNSSDKASKFKEAIAHITSDQDEISVAQYKEIITVDINKGFDCLSGDLKDNVLFKNLDPEYSNSNFTVAINNKEIPELATLLSGALNTIYISGLTSSLPVANAQLIQPEDQPKELLMQPADQPRGTLIQPEDQPKELLMQPADQPSGTLIQPEDQPKELLIPIKDQTKRIPDIRNIGILTHTFENTFIYSDLQNSDLNIEIQIKIMDEENIKDVSLFQKITKVEIEKLYENFDQTFNKDVNELFEIAKDNDINIKATSKYENMQITINMKFDLEEIVPTLL